MSDDQKFREIEMLLAAYRPDGSDAGDPDMREALDRVEEDDELRALFEDSRAFDAAVSDALSSIPVPADLRDEIAATIPSSAPARKRPTLIRRLLPIAAVLLFALGITIFFTTAAPDPSWVAAPIDLLESVSGGDTEPDLIGAPPADTLAWLQTRFDASIALPVSLATLPSKACTYKTGSDGKLAIICFDGGGGTIVHLLIQEAKGSPSDPMVLPESCCRSKVKAQGNWETLAWSHAGRRYVLAANAESEPCCKRLRELAGIRA